MKKEINYTLLSDGSSDRMLMPIITWSLKQNLGQDVLIQPDWANLYHASANLDLYKKINYSLDKFPCDILFVHRDSEKKSESVVQERKQEIEDAWINSVKNSEKYVPVIPIRMSEAWLLVDELAIRSASGNPNSTIPIQFPKISRLESLPNPKEILEALIRKASGLRGRNLKKLNVDKAKHRVAEHIVDFSPLKRLTAFQTFESDLKSVLLGLYK